MDAGERERIENAYRRRDAAAHGRVYSFGSPAYVFGMHELEWALLGALRDAQVPLAGRVLDVGCGAGYYLNRLREYGLTEAFGIELMDDRVSEAHRRYPALDVRKGDAAALPFEDDAFDVVTQFTVLSSILEPASRAAVGREMLRVTRSGGALVSVDLLPPSRLRERVRRLRRRQAAGPTPTEGLDRDALTALFGTPPVAVRAFGFHMGLGPVVGRSRLAAHLLACVPPLRTHLVAVFESKR